MYRFMFEDIDGTTRIETVVSARTATVAINGTKRSAIVFKTFRQMDTALVWVCPTSAANAYLKNAIGQGYANLQVEGTTYELKEGCCE